MLKEPEIKLFGRKIYVPENGTAVACGERAGEWSNESSGGSSDCDRCLEQSRGQDGKEVGSKEQQEQSDEELAEGEICESSAENEESQSTGAPSESDENPKTPPPDVDVKLENEDNGAATNPEQKTLKKPDKIIPCPRCNSMDTKFCYFNNYNVNQPRHFCKSCQRYWTAGGTMRNVPVGAGRRKNKNCRHITISEALHSNGFHNLKFKPNGTVLSFGPDSNQIAEKRAPNGYCSKRNDCATSPSIAMPNPAVDGFQHRASMHGMNGFPCVPWPFPWNTAVLPPMPYYLWNSGGWDAASPNSPLGKHSRSGEVVDLQGEKRRGSIVVPKTLRMDDPKEAARSSIRSTLGIKYDSISREGLFKALQPNGSDKKPAMAAVASPLMQANPAALSRSLAFQERT